MNATEIITNSSSCTDAGFYISIAGNVLSVVLLIVSEFMGANTKSKFNGIVDVISKVAKGSSGSDDDSSAAAAE